MDMDRQGIKRSNDSIDLYDCAVCCTLCLAVFAVSEVYEEGVSLCRLVSFWTGIAGLKLRAYEEYNSHLGLKDKSACG